MEMNSKERLLYDRAVPHQLSFFTELISDVYDELEGVTWSRASEYEIGFYSKDKVSKDFLFFGIWYEAWEKYQVPLCFAFFYNQKARGEMYDRFKKYVEGLNINGLAVYDFEEHFIITIEQEYFNHQDDAERLTALMVDLAKFAKIQDGKSTKPLIY